MAYERASAEQDAAAQALDVARDNAITLSDGRRVYFSADGEVLYGEDHEQLHEEAVVIEARRAFEAQPQATTYETYAASYSRLEAATQELASLGDTLERLDDIRTELSDDNLTPEELKQLQNETQEIIQSLPSDVRSDFESLQAVRQGDRPLAYREVDPAVDAPLNLTDPFHAADSQPVAETPNDSTDEETEPVRPPAYRSAPEF